MLSIQLSKSKYERSEPIPIQSKRPALDEDVEYCLKQNFFNPNKGSPPNQWNERLIQRLGESYDNKPFMSQVQMFSRK
jgi:hypothetical protein